MQRVNEKSGGVERVDQSEGMVSLWTFESQECPEVGVQRVET